MIPIWSPSANEITFPLDEGDVFSVPAEGGGEPKLLASTESIEALV